MNFHLRVAATVAILATATAAAEHAAPRLPPALADTLRWFPATTDALVVAADFKLADARGVLARVDDPLPAFLRGLATSRALGDADEPEPNTPATPLWRPVRHPASPPNPDLTVRPDVRLTVR